MIGGRDAEEMSDLSDCSDSALEEVISDLRDISQQNYIKDEIEDRTIDTGFISLNDEHSSDSLVEAANPECQSRYSCKFIYRINGRLSFHKQHLLSYKKQSKYFYYVLSVHNYQHLFVNMFLNGFSIDTTFF